MQKGCAGGKGLTHFFSASPGENWGVKTQHDTSNSLEVAMLQVVEKW